MRSKLRKLVNYTFGKFNLKVQRISGNEFGFSLADDIERILLQIGKKQDQLIIFDVGSNVGQSILSYKDTFPDAVIYAFEPSKQIFSALQHNTKHLNQIHYNNFGLGNQNGSVTFYENESSDISSFLEPTDQLWGKVVRSQDIEIRTLDSYVKETAIEKINFLKIDTQGFDLEVLKGSKESLQKKRIDLVQLEITISGFYKDQPRMDEVLKYLLDHDYRLVAFYGFHNSNVAASWTDTLFIAPDLFSDVT